jgi:hypothetical protein
MEWPFFDHLDSFSHLPAQQLLQYRAAHVSKIIFNRDVSLAIELHAGSSSLFAHQHVAALGET